MFADTSCWIRRMAGLATLAFAKRQECSRTWTRGFVGGYACTSGCNGLAFRIAAEEVEAETKILWRREQVLPAYNAEFIDVDLSDARISALTFVADVDADVIDGNLTRDEQICYFATGNGFLGTSLD